VPFPVLGVDRKVTAGHQNDGNDPTETLSRFSVKYDAPSRHVHVSDLTSLRISSPGPFIKWSGMAAGLVISGGIGETYL